MLSREAVRTQSLNYLDFFRQAGISPRTLLEPMQVKGREYLDQALRGGHGAIIASAHLGSVDRLGASLLAMGYKCAALVEPLQPPELLELVSSIRVRMGDGELIPLDAHTVTRAGAALRRNTVLGIATDYDISRNGISVPFFGHQLDMPVGPALLAIRYRTPLLPARCIRVGTSRFALIIEPPIEPAATGSLADRLRDTSARLAAVIERHIRETPGQWVMFHHIWADGQADVQSSSSESGTGVRS